MAVLGSLCNGDDIPPEKCTIEENGEYPAITGAK